MTSSATGLLIPTPERMTFIHHWVDLQMPTHLNQSSPDWEPLVVNTLYDLLEVPFQFLFPYYGMPFDRMTCSPMGICFFGLDTPNCLDNADCLKSSKFASFIAPLLTRYISNDPMVHVQSLEQSLHLKIQNIQPVLRHPSQTDTVGFIISVYSTGAIYFRYITAPSLAFSEVTTSGPVFVLGLASPGPKSGIAEAFDPNYPRGYFSPGDSHSTPFGSPAYFQGFYTELAGVFPSRNHFQFLETDADRKPAPSSLLFFPIHPKACVVAPVALPFISGSNSGALWTDSQIIHHLPKHVSPFIHFFFRSSDFLSDLDFFISKGTSQNSLFDFKQSKKSQLEDLLSEIECVFQIVPVTSSVRTWNPSLVTDSSPDTEDVLLTYTTLPVIDVDSMRITCELGISAFSTFSISVEDHAVDIFLRHVPSLSPIPFILHGDVSGSVFDDSFVKFDPSITKSSPPIVGTPSPVRLALVDLFNPSQTLVNLAEDLKRRRVSDETNESINEHPHLTSQILNQILCSSTCIDFVSASTTKTQELLAPKFLCFQDCEGIPGGRAVIDDCGECSMGTTGRKQNMGFDCNGICYGGHILNSYGQCICSDQKCVPTSVILKQHSSWNYLSHDGMSNLTTEPPPQFVAIAKSTYSPEASVNPEYSAVIFPRPTTIHMDISSPLSFFLQETSEIRLFSKFYSAASLDHPQVMSLQLPFSLPSGGLLTDVFTRQIYVSSHGGVFLNTVSSIHGFKFPVKPPAFSDISKEERELVRCIKDKYFSMFTNGSGDGLDSSTSPECPLAFYGIINKWSIDSSDSLSRITVSFPVASQSVDFVTIRYQNVILPRSDPMDQLIKATFEIILYANGVTKIRRVKMPGFEGNVIDPSNRAQALIASPKDNPCFIGCNLGPNFSNYIPSQLFEPSPSVVTFSAQSGNGKSQLTLQRFSSTSLANLAKIQLDWQVLSMSLDLETGLSSGTSDDPRNPMTYLTDLPLPKEHLFALPRESYFISPFLPFSDSSENNLEKELSSESILEDQLVSDETSFFQVPIAYCLATPSGPALETASSQSGSNSIFIILHANSQLNNGLLSARFSEDFRPKRDFFDTHVLDSLRFVGNSLTHSQERYHGTSFDSQTMDARGNNIPLVEQPAHIVYYCAYSIIIDPTGEFLLDETDVETQFINPNVSSPKVEPKVPRPSKLSISPSSSRAKYNLELHALECVIPQLVAGTLIQVDLFAMTSNSHVDEPELTSIPKEAIPVPLSPTSPPLLYYFEESSGYHARNPFSFQPVDSTTTGSVAKSDLWLEKYDKLMGKMFCSHCGSFSGDLCPLSCANVFGGDEKMDDCGVCSLGTTNKKFNANMDCMGQCFGPFVKYTSPESDGDTMELCGCPDSKPECSRLSSFATSIYLDLHGNVMSQHNTTNAHLYSQQSLMTLRAFAPSTLIFPFYPTIQSVVDNLQYDHESDPKWLPSSLGMSTIKLENANTMGASQSDYVKTPVLITSLKNSSLNSLLNVLEIAVLHALRANPIATPDTIATHPPAPLQQVSPKSNFPIFYNSAQSPFPVSSGIFAFGQIRSDISPTKFSRVKFDLTKPLLGAKLLHINAFPLTFIHTPFPIATSIGTVSGLYVSSFGAVLASLTPPTAQCISSFVSWTAQNVSTNISQRSSYDFTLFSTSLCRMVVIAPCFTDFDVMALVETELGIDYSSTSLAQLKSSEVVYFSDEVTKTLHIKYNNMRLALSPEHTTSHNYPSSSNNDVSTLHQYVSFGLTVSTSGLIEFQYPAPTIANHISVVSVPSVLVHKYDGLFDGGLRYQHAHMLPFFRNNQSSIGGDVEEMIRLLSLVGLNTFDRLYSQIFNNDVSSVAKQRPFYVGMTPFISTPLSVPFNLDSASNGDNLGKYTYSQECSFGGFSSDSSRSFHLAHSLHNVASWMPWMVSIDHLKSFSLFQSTEPKSVSMHYIDLLDNIIPPSMFCSGVMSPSRPMLLDTLVSTSNISLSYCTMPRTLVPYMSNLNRYSSLLLLIPQKQSLEQTSSCFDAPQKEEGYVDTNLYSSNSQNIYCIVAHVFSPLGIESSSVVSSTEVQFVPGLGSLECDIPHNKLFNTLSPQFLNARVTLEVFLAFTPDPTNNSAFIRIDHSSLLFSYLVVPVSAGSLHRMSSHIFSTPTAEQNSLCSHKFSSLKSPYTQKYCLLDCNNTPGGSAFLDRCGKCVGGTTRRLAGYSIDCSGTCSGPFSTDLNGIESPVAKKVAGRKLSLLDEQFLHENPFDLFLLDGCYCDYEKHPACQTVRNSQLRSLGHISYGDFIESSSYSYVEQTHNDSAPVIEMLITGQLHTRENTENTSGNIAGLTYLRIFLLILMCMSFVYVLLSVVCRKRFSQDLNQSTMSLFDRFASRSLFYFPKTDIDLQESRQTIALPVDIYEDPPGYT